MTGPVERHLRARLGDGVGLAPYEARGLGTLAGVLFGAYQRRALVVRRAGERWHLRERLAPDELRAAVLARSEREAEQAQREARDQVERDRAAERAQLRREVLSARTVDEARRLVADHRALAIADQAQDCTTEALIVGDLGALFGIELDMTTAATGGA